MTLTGLTGTKYILDPAPIGSGEEGEIHRIQSEPDKVAKIYRPGVLTDELTGKLTVMINNPPGEEAMSQIAWPLDLVADDSGRYCGIVMQEPIPKPTAQTRWQSAANAKSASAKVKPEFLAAALLISVGVLIAGLVIAISADTQDRSDATISSEPENSVIEPALTDLSQQQTNQRHDTGQCNGHW